MKTGGLSRAGFVTPKRTWLAICSLSASWRSTSPASSRPWPTRPLTIEEAPRGSSRHEAGARAGRSPGLPFHRSRIGIARSPVVGQQFLAFGEQAFLHHLVLANGEIIDFFVQSTQQRLTPELRLILGCRDEDFAHLLVANQRRARVETAAEVEPATVQRVLTAFWINTHKHRKVLHRNLDLMVTFGFDVEKALLVRLWYLEVSGKDCGDVRQGTIHTLTSIIRTLEQAAGDEVRSVMGVPMRTRAEIYHAVESNRNVISGIGRRLAQKYGFVYPADLEATVRQGWQEFLAQE